MFGHASQDSKIYEYGAREPLDCTQINEQLWLAHRYRNRLVELELQRRQEVDACLRAYNPELLELRSRWEEAEEALEQLEAEISQENIRAASRKPGQDRKQELRAARRERNERRKLYYNTRRPLFTDPGSSQQLAAVEAADKERRRQARADCGLYWGTYLAVEQGAQSFRTGEPPRFRRWSGEGKLAVQLQGGLSSEELLTGQDQRLQLGLFEPGYRLNRKGELVCSGDPASRRSQLHRCGLLSFRVGSTEQGRPVWAQVPMSFHRPLPEGCQIKWAYLWRHKVAAHYQWNVQLVVSRASGFPREDAASEGVVGVDIGWRRLSDGSLRVAYAAGDDDQEEELILSAERLAAWEHVEDIRSRRDRLFNEHRDQLKDWLEEQEPQQAWLTQATNHLHQWRSPARLASLVLRWQGRLSCPVNVLPAERFAGDEGILTDLEAWRKQDKRLWEEEANLRKKLINWREYHYYDFAVRLRRRYHTVSLEKIDWRKLTKLPELGEDDPISPRWRFIAAPGRLQEILREAFAEHKNQLPEYTTQRCNHCRRQAILHIWGDDPDFDPSRLHHRCGHCSCREDQDRNAALNLLDDASVSVMS